MEPQRLGSAAGGGIIGALIGVLVSIWWLDSAPVGATVILCDGHWGGPRLRPGDSCLGVARRVAHVALVNLRQSLDLAQEFGDAVYRDLGGGVHDVERHGRSRGYPDARLPGSPVADCRSRARVPVC